MGKNLNLPAVRGIARAGQSSPTGRRGVLALAAGTAALSAATLLVAGADSAQRDAELIGLCEQFVSLQRGFHSLFPADNQPAGFGFGTASIEDDDEREEALDPIDAQQIPLVPLIMALPAQTLDGYRAKAAVIWMMNPYMQQEAERYGSMRDRLIFDLVANLVGEA